nr:hypothetical protein [Tanacetum cinerariifolium]
MVLERLSQPTADPLALLSNVSNTQHGSPSSSTSSITPLPPPRANSTDDLIENLTSTLALLTQSYKTFLPQTNSQLRTSSNPRNQATVQDGYEEAQNRVGNVNQGQARPGQARTAIQIGDIRETLAESTEGTPQFGLKRPHVYSDLNSEERDRQHKEESINDYIVKFSKLINDMRNIKMTMPKLQLNSKFVNNMLPEWGRFVTAVKLNRGLRESNYDQLFAYLKQHEAHAKKNKMVLERLC